MEYAAVSPFGFNDRSSFRNVVKREYQRERFNLGFNIVPAKRGNNMILRLIQSTAR